MKQFKPISRRTLLRGVSATMALPLLDAMAPVSSLIAGEVASQAPPVRMAFFYLPNGMHMPHWKPTGQKETGFELPEIFKPVKRFRKDMNIISGLTLQGANAQGDGGGDHARSVAAFLTGAHPRKTHGANIRNGISIDQVAAKRIGNKTRLASLELGTESSAQAGRCDSGYSCTYTSNISWRTKTSPLAKEMDPAAVFDRLFGVQANKQVANRRKKSVLDFVNEDAKALNRKLGVNDRRKLDEYQHAVREIERRLVNTEKLGKVESDVPDYPRPAGVPAEYGEHVKLMFDMTALALQTDSTRILTFMYANAGSNRSYRNLGISGGHHNLSHHGGSFAKKQKIAKINHYHMQLFGYLLDKLSNIKEGNGSLLDNCMLMYGSGIADGNSHNHGNLPIAMFGGAGGTIQTGRHIRVRPGTPLTNLYVSMLDRMGVTVDSFSDSNGRIDELTGQEN